MTVNSYDFLYVQLCPVVQVVKSSDVLIVYVNWDSVIKFYLQLS